MLDNLLTPFYHTAVPLWALIDAFFLYSFLGWCMECVVIRREKGEWENRGFVRSPFCIIYGFGARLQATMWCCMWWEPWRPPRLNTLRRC